MPMLTLLMLRQIKVVVNGDFGRDLEATAWRAWSAKIFCIGERVGAVKVVTKLC